MIIQQKTNIRLKFEICSEHKVIKVSQCHMDFNSELYFRIKWWEEGPSIIVVELVYLRRSTKTVLIASVWCLRIWRSQMPSKLTPLSGIFMKNKNENLLIFLGDRTWQHCLRCCQVYVSPATHSNSVSQIVHDPATLRFWIQY